MEHGLGLLALLPDFEAGFGPAFGHCCCPSEMLSDGGCLSLHRCTGSQLPYDKPTWGRGRLLIPQPALLLASACAVFVPHDSVRPCEVLASWLSARPSAFRGNTALTPALLPCFPFSAVRRPGPCQRCAQEPAREEGQEAGVRERQQTACNDRSERIPTAPHLCSAYERAIGLSAAPAARSQMDGAETSSCTADWQT